MSIVVRYPDPDIYRNSIAFTAISRFSNFLSGNGPRLAPRPVAVSVDLQLNDTVNIWHSNLLFGSIVIFLLCSMDTHYLLY